MNARTIKDNFWRIGARVMVEARRGPLALDSGPCLDVSRDERGELFRLAVHPLRMHAVEFLDVRPGQQRLLMNLGEGDLFLCGRDPMGLLAIRLPEGAPAHSVRAAVESLDSQALALPPMEVSGQERRFNRPARLHRELSKLSSGSW
ncbi:MAG: hypothetical protein L0Y44_13120 [Phycisphaerales bacterium]|nr:hypothetical protein [Phycisphaerales bacterium]MCI0631585.1 hypothetical protein [Phycisphaerales bacterium]MCI0674154.1 hypothetical protein [Phycisphaerales bacterium]